MPRDQRSVAVEQSFAAEFAALSNELWGCAPADLDDTSFRQVANEVALNNAGKIVYGARIAAGDTIDFTAAPNLAQRLAIAGASDESVREFAQAAFPDLSPSAAMRAYAADIQRWAGGTGSEPPKSAEPLFDRPF